MEKRYLNLNTALSGLVVHPEYPHLGVLPGGIVMCECCGLVIFEIKCPSVTIYSNVKF